MKEAAIAIGYLLGTSVAFGVWQGIAAGLWFFGMANLVALAMKRLGLIS